MQRTIFLLLLLFALSNLSAQSNRTEKARANQYLRDARIYRADGALEQSKALLRKASPIFKKLEMWSKYCRTENLISEHFEYEENWDSVKAIQERVLVESVRYLGNNNRFELHAYIILGEVHQRREEYRLALEYLTRALSLIDRKPVGKQDLRTAVNSQMGAVYAAMGDYPQALEAFEAAEVASTKKPAAELPVLAKHKANYARALLGSANAEKALTLAKASLELHLSLYGTNHYKTAEIRMLIAQIYMQQKAYEEAEKILKSALAKLKNESKHLATFAEGYMLLGRLYVEKEEFALAQQSWEEGIRFLTREIGNEHPLIARLHYALAEIAMESGAKGEALSHIGNALKAVMPLTQDPFQFNAKRELLLSVSETLRFFCLKQKLHWKSYQENKQSFELEEMLKVFTQVQSLELLLDLEEGNAQQRYELYLLKKQMAVLAAQAAAALQKKDLLIQILEWERWSWKGYILSKAWPEALNKLDKELDEQEKALVQKYQSLLGGLRKAILRKEVLDNVQQELLEVKEKYLQFIQHLQREHPQHYAHFHEMPKLGEKDLAISIGEGALVTFLYSENQYYRFYYDVQSWSFKPVPNVSSLLQELWGMLKTDAPIKKDLFGQKAYILYQKMMQEIFPDSFPNTLHIIADEGLSKFPIEVLLTEPAKGKIKNWAFLFKKMPISYHFSVAELLKQPKSYQHKEMLVLASSYKDRTPARYAEAKAWTKGYNQANKFRKRLKAKCLSNYEATETHLRQEDFSQYQAVHLGYWVEMSQTLPQIYLHYEYDSIYDGRLSLSELPNWELNLMTLAHLGDTAANWEQQAVLLLALQTSGVETILWPSWELPPAASQALLLAFYQNLAKGLPKTEAWQLAQKEYLEKAKGKQQYPYYWAAFRLSGQDGELLIDKKTVFPWTEIAIAVGSMLLLLLIFFLLWRKARG